MPWWWNFIDLREVLKNCVSFWLDLKTESILKDHQI